MDRERVIRFLEHELHVNVHGGLRADTSLIESGALDSLGILRLALWIENEVGRSLDPSTIQLPTDWNTIDSILAFIARTRNHDRSAATR